MNPHDMDEIRRNIAAKFEAFLPQHIQTYREEWEAGIIQKRQKATEGFIKKRFKKTPIQPKK